MDSKIYNAMGLVTSHDPKEGGSFIQISSDILYLYNALPQPYIQSALAIFNCIMRTKYYGGTNKPNEDRRIYNDQRLNLSDILMEIQPQKYLENPNRLNILDADINNLTYKVKWLNDNNIFYRLNVGRAHIFFLERNCVSWKHFNSTGCVVPKTIKKILYLREDFTQRLVQFIEDEDKKPNMDRVYNCVGEFICNMIRKMNPDIASQFPVWEKDLDLSVYCLKVDDVVKNMKDDAGIVIAPDFLLKIPLSVKEKVKGELNMTDNTQKDMDLDKDLAPKKRNLGKTRRVKRSDNVPLVVEEMVEVGNWRYSVVNPLRDSKTLTKYYRHFVRHYSNQRLEGLAVEFDQYEADARSAAEILDLLRERNRLEELFLRKWLEDFCETQLKGQSVRYRSKVSMKNFKRHFEQFDQKYHIPA